ncbi:MAG: hypothetical protein LUE11_03800 [Clostridia bacterium]|nr:hypothetical protein [Clostridia bacterium]
MTDFQTKAQRFLWRTEKQYPQPFEVQRDVSICGKSFPMTAQYEQQDKRYLLGIKSRISRENLCGEKYFFDCCETLDEQAFAEYKALFKRLQDELVPADNPAHDYTFISFVLCTANVGKGIQKKIKRTNDYRQYKYGQYGWSALRLCVVDLEAETYYCNGMGKGIWECLTREEIPQEQNKLFGLF